MFLPSTISSTSSDRAKCGRCRCRCAPRCARQRRCCMSTSFSPHTNTQRVATDPDNCLLGRAFPRITEPFLNRSRYSLSERCPIPIDISLFLLHDRRIELTPMLFGIVIPLDCENVQHQRNDQDHHNGPETPFRRLVIRSLRPKSSNETDGGARRYGDSSDHQKDRRPLRRDSGHIGNKWVHCEKEDRWPRRERRECNDRIGDLLKSTDRSWYLIGRRGRYGTDAHAVFLECLSLDARMHLWLGIVR